jgi:hypothetical protein
MNDKRKPRRSRASANLRAADQATKPYVVKISFIEKHDDGQEWEAELVACLHLTPSDQFADEQLEKPLREMIENLRKDDPSYLESEVDVYLEWMFAIPSETGLLWEEHAKLPDGPRSRLLRAHADGFGAPDDEDGNRTPTPMFHLSKRPRRSA